MARGRKQRRRSRHRRNPTSRQVATWAGAAIAAGLVGYGAYRFNRSRRGPKYELPQPPQGTGEPVPIACELGPRYPGFEQDSSGACVPTDATPPGYYVDVNCTDFVFVPGPGAQSQDLAKTIASLAAITKDPKNRSADPTYNVTQFLSKYWPDCTWPPVGGTPRLQQLFVALSFLIGREVQHRGGRVLGTGNVDEIDERIATRLAQLGMPPYDQRVVPEILLPDYQNEGEPGIAQPPGPGPDINEPGPTQGTIDLPPGGPVMPGDFPFPEYHFVPPAPPVLKHCQEVPYTKSQSGIDVDDAFWAQQFVGGDPLPKTTHDFLIFDFDISDFSECKAWNIRFGLCLQPTGGAIYGLLNPNNPLPDNPLHLRNEDGAGLVWAQFTSKPLWKRQYSAVIGLANTTGKAVADQPHPINDPGVDPCSNDELIWPTPSVNHFLVTADWGAEPRFRETIWEPRPRVSIVTSGRKVYARLHYVGMPRFLMVGADPQWGGIDAPTEQDGHLVSSTAQKTSFEAAYKVWALGIS